MSGRLEGKRVALGAVALLAPWTGIGQYTYHLAREMRALLAQPPWLFYGGEWSEELRPPPPIAVETVFRIKRAVPYGYRIARFLQQRRFSAGARAHRFDLYHEPNFLAFRFAGPTVATVHDLSWIRFPEMHPVERVKSMNETMPDVVKRAARIIVVSDFVRGEVLAHYGLPPERVVAVPNGVAAEFAPLGEAACAAALSAHRLAYGRYILAVGTLEPRKNIATTLEAYARLPQSARQRFPLVIAGIKGWGEMALAAPVRAMVDRGEVRFTGYVPQESLPMLYSGARLFVYPSIYEGFGLPPLEAMACGAPVIVSDRTSLPEVVGEAGVKVDPFDAAALAQRMGELLEDDLLRGTLSAAGIERAKRFTWRRCAEETLAVYEKALGA